MEIVTDFIPKPGDIVKHTLPSGQVYKYTWTICPECLEGRWVQVAITKRPFFTGLCGKCYIKAAKATNWPGGGC